MAMHPRASLIPVTAMVFLVLMGGTLASGRAQSGPDTCPPALVLGSRGSGSPDSGSMGAPGDAFFQELRRRLPGVQNWANPYPAVGVFSWNWRQLVNGLGAATKLSGLGLGAYHDSVMDGERRLLGRIRTIAARCGTQTPIILTGYSQGAQATADVFQRDLTAKERALITGVVLFGDPYFNSSDKAVAQGSFSGRRNGLLGKRPTFMSPDRRIVSYCHSHDPICQGFGIALGGVPVADPGSLTLKQHSNYTKFGEPAKAANLIAARSAFIYRFPLPRIQSVIDSACGGGTLVAEYDRKVLNNRLAVSATFAWTYVPTEDDHIRVWQTGPTSFCWVTLGSGRIRTVAGKSPSGSGQLADGVTGQVLDAYVGHADGTSLDPSAKRSGFIGTLDWHCQIVNHAPQPCYSTQDYTNLLVNATSRYTDWEYRVRSDSGDIWWNAHDPAGTTTAVIVSGDITH